MKWRDEIKKAVLLNRSKEDPKFEASENNCTTGDEDEERPHKRSWRPT
jgi:hypothetical protein